MKAILAIDQSTSATKAILFDAAGEVLASASRDHAQHYPQPGWIEHDAGEIWGNVCALICEIMEGEAAAVADIAALSLTNQRETILVWDRETGRPLRPAIVWQCTRGAEICEEIKNGGHEQQVERRTGLRIDTYFSASKLTWLMREEPEVAEALREG
ncbi:MAG: FGGY family carbohydrate kinase, partial [Verrucomicrobiales bacterium]